MVRSSPRWASAIVVRRAVSSASALVADAHPGLLGRGSRPLRKVGALVLELAQGGVEVLDGQEEGERVGLGGLGCHGGGVPAAGAAASTGAGAGGGGPVRQLNTGVPAGTEVNGQAMSSTSGGIGAPVAFLSTP